MAAEVRFPVDWLDPHAGDVATDLDLAVLLVNSYDALDDPPDRLGDLSWWRGVLCRVGHAAITDTLEDHDLPALRVLRSGLRAGFEATEAAGAAAALNPLMRTAGAVPHLLPDPVLPGTARIGYAPSAEGLLALQIRLPVAVAQRIADKGISSLGACAADPCHCVFVDRTRASIRRFCCGWCNDRAASRAYRRRQSH